jgi:hypothetical protein
MAASTASHYLGQANGHARGDQVFVSSDGTTWGQRDRDGHGHHGDDVDQLRPPCTLCALSSRARRPAAGGRYDFNVLH